MSISLTSLEKISYLSSRVIRILGCNPSPVTLLGTNTYIVGSGRERLLIDTGNPNVPEYQQLLSKVLEETKSVITKIIITHYHPDHIGGLTDVRKLCHNNNIPAYKMDFVCDKERSAHGDYPSEVEIISDKHEFKVDGATLRAHYNPGHSDDHMVVWLDEEKALFTADSVLGEGTSQFVNLKQYMKSLEDIKDMKADVVYPGHGPVVENVLEHVSGYISHRLEREKQVVTLLQTADHSATSIVEILYKDYPRTLHGYAASVILLHLKKLQQDGTITMAGGQVDESTLWTLTTTAKL